MKWAEYQADLIKKLIAGDSFLVYVDNDCMEIVDKYTVFRIPIFFLHVYMGSQHDLSISYIKKTIDLSGGAHEFMQLLPRRVELQGKIPVQIFSIPETGDEVKVNTRLYSKYTEKADQLTFWGKDFRSPVIAINGEIWNEENIVFLVLPIV